MSDLDFWETSEEEIEDSNYQVECFQFERPVSDLKEYEWAEIRRIARECYKSGMFGSDQLKCAVEGYYRWIALCTLNENLSEEIKSRQPRVTH